MEENSKIRAATLPNDAYKIILRWLEEWKSETEPTTWNELAEIDDLSRCHFGLGLYIRNQYLWKDPALVRKLGGGHPDDVSGMILYIWRDELQRQLSLGVVEKE